MECLKCHTPLPDNSRFCFACGADQTGGGVDGQSSGPIEVLQARLQHLVQGKYEIKRLLGKGGMGAVFLAHDLTLEREVAIKVLPPDFSSDPQVIKRFQQEAKTAAKLDHTNIIPIFRVESEEGLNYFVMKYVSGTTLEDLMESKQEISHDYVQRLLWEAACALGHAHSRGVVHRDVKPANIMFDHDGKVMLTDFGISKALQSANITGTGMILGTPHYMAPEQAKGQPVDGRTDQYSLGVVGYRLLTGALPFSGDSVHTILYKHIFEEAPRLSGLRQNAPQYLTDPIQRALSKEPAQRFPTMEDFATALWPEQPVSATGKSTPKPARQRPAARGPVTADTPTEHVRDASGAAAPTTPLPSSVRPRTVPHPTPRPTPKQSSSKVGVFVLVAVAVVGAGGYLVLRGGGGGESPQSATAIEPSPASAPPAGQQSVVVTPQSTATAAAPPPVTPTPPPSAPAATPRQTTRPPQRPTPPRQPPIVQPPPVQQPPAEEWGYLSINANPFGTVFIDGVQVGDTPIDRHKVKPGPHTIRIENPGYRTITERVQVDPGNTIRKTYPLVPEG
jgi:serine/threonine-protein kinase